MYLLLLILFTIKIYNRIIFSKNELLVKAKTSKNKAKVLMGSFKRNELSVPNQKPSSQVVTDANSPFDFPFE